MRQNKPIFFNYFYTHIIIFENKSKNFEKNLLRILLRVFRFNIIFCQVMRYLERIHVYMEDSYKL